MEKRPHYGVASPKGWWKRNFVKYRHQRVDGKDCHRQRVDGKKKSGYVLIKGLMEKTYYVMYAYDVC